MLVEMIDTFLRILAPTGDHFDATKNVACSEALDYRFHTICGKGNPCTEEETDRFVAKFRDEFFKIIKYIL